MGKLFARKSTKKQRKNSKIIEKTRQNQVNLEFLYNLMLTKWVDHEGNEHRVIDDYERNKLLVDLHAQPEAIVEELDQTITQAKAENKSIDQVGIRFMKFCAKYDLNRISEQAQLYVEPFNARLSV